MRRVGRWTLGLIVFILSVPYAAAPIYSVAPAKPLSGNTWFNPYANANGQWIKANVHLHTRTWWGATDGHKNSLRAVDSVYRAFGYGALALSNYQQITELGQSWKHLPCYEHGYNIQKTHQLALGAQSVIWLDCILPQTLFVKQWILDVLRPTCSVLIAAHPAFGRPSYTAAEMAHLANYHCIEVFNHYRTSLVHWDSALSAGIAVWAVGNDDCHDVSSEGETGVCLTLLPVPQTWSANDLYQAYQQGATIAVRTSRGQLPIGVPHQILRNDSLIIELDGIADSVRFVTHGGTEFFVAKHCSRAAAPLSLARGYLRAEVYAGSTLYALNPVIRTEAHHLTQYRRLHEDGPLTMLYRTLWLLIYIRGIVLLRGRKR
ncbi:MAG: hypothetical protein KatS3mg039_0858 [Candidatus Kapaibacterium sp.]|nr:MAG: hypothetical protein KatS3mg039_0858 [Candidatus Kapabacteria bacterium]